MAQGRIIIRRREEALPAETVKILSDMLKTIRFGSITLIVQDGVLLQIDKTEKVRFSEAG